MRLKNKILITKLRRKREWEKNELRKREEEGDYSICFNREGEHFSMLLFIYCLFIDEGEMK